MKKTFEELNATLNGLRRDINFNTDVNIINYGDREDTFLASWRYPVRHISLIDDNFIELNYCFKLDVDHIKLLWSKNYKGELGYLITSLSKCFFEILPLLNDMNGTGDNYEKIVEIIHDSLGATISEEFGF